MTTPTPPRLHEEAADRIRTMLSEGFHAPDDVLSSVVDLLADEHDEAEVQRVAESVLPTILAERAAEMRSWPAVTDCDRLDAAFEELNARGVMARHNWWCCGTCGASAMPDEFERLDGEWEGVPITGYTFYHEQGTEAAAQGEDLYLSYGSCEETESEADYESRSVAIAAMVVDALKRQGLKVNWDGTYEKRIGVLMKWQRRTPPRRFLEGD